MDYYAGIDVSLEWSSVCVVNAKGEVMKEVKILWGGRTARGCGTLGALSNDANGAPHVATF